MKWKELNQYIDDVVNTMHTREGNDNTASAAGAGLRLLLEIHGDLDQMVVLQRKHTEMTAVIMSHWIASEERAARNEARAVEHHASSMELERLLIERERRQAAMDLAYQEKWGLKPETEKFLRQILGGPLTVETSGDAKQE